MFEVATSESDSEAVSKKRSEAVSSIVIKVSEAVSSFVIKKVSETVSNIAKEVTGLLEPDVAAVTSHETFSVTNGSFKGGQISKIAKR